MPEGSVSKRKPLMTRRGFLKTLGATALAGTATYTYGATIGVNALTVEHVTVPIPGLAARWHNQRIVQLSDLHAGRASLELIGRAFEMALDLKPEVLLITGDFVDSTAADLAGLDRLLLTITSKVETIGSTGNHDFSNSFHDRIFADIICNGLRSAGVRMLRNAVYQPKAGPGELCFVGLEDISSRLCDPTALRSAPSDASIILLSHNPDSYERCDLFTWHLMLSGHTHGGQVCIPGIGPLILPITHRERAAGLMHLNAALPHRALYVTRGVGHLLKIRLFCPPEVSCITLQNPAML